MLSNVFFDFSATMTYYAGSDLLRPFQRYLLHSSDRILFGSDWPTANPEQQMAESVRLATEVSISSAELERMFLGNAERLWPEMFHPASRGLGSNS
jgi:predicted TIM-barrel fold metal-dependent hydrolase